MGGDGLSRRLKGRGGLWRMKNKRDIVALGGHLEGKVGLPGGIFTTWNRGKGGAHFPRGQKGGERHSSRRGADACRKYLLREVSKIPWNQG